MPYRVDVPYATAQAFDRLVELGALDIEPLDNGLAAIMPDSVPPGAVAGAIGVRVQVTPARARDDGSTWIVLPRECQIGRVQIIPADHPGRPGAVRLFDAPAFGTGLHPTTALCLEALDTELDTSTPSSVLDVGTGSGVLALSALALGVPEAVAIDIDSEAAKAAEDNAALNGVASRLRVVHGGPEALAGSWPLVVANVLASPLIEMAPTLAERVGHSGRLVLSGVRTSLAREVTSAYQRVGMRQVSANRRDGWSALILHASW
jgi:ribosomal protein L11 methyltransferase